MPFVLSNGANIYYQERGNPLSEPLLLIMGITAAGNVWEPHVQEWQGNFRCILPDNRGVGLSDKPEGPYTTAQMADDCAIILETLGLKAVRVVGVSMGSTIAMQLALRHSSLVKSMVLMCPWARCDAQAKAIFEHMMTCKARFRPEEFSHYIQHLIFSRATLNDPEKTKDLEDSRAAAAIDPYPQPLHALEAQAHACITHDVLADLPKIIQPTLIIGGEEDIFTPQWMAKEVTNAIPEAELFLYPAAGHAFHFEHTNHFNHKIANWLLDQ